MNRKQAIREAKRVFNHVGILCDSEICRCIGFEDSGEDFYWKIIAIGGEIRYSSMVGPFVSLKTSRYPRYKQMEEQMHELWNAPRAEKFIPEVYEFDSYKDMIKYYHGEDIKRRKIDWE